MALVFGQPGGDTLVGTDADDVLRAQSGDDLLRGLGGNDRLLAGAGDDRLEGGGGNDSLDGGFGVDTAILTGVAAGYLVVALGGTSLRISDLDPTDGDDGEDLLTNVERLQFADAVRVLDGGNNRPAARDDDLTGATGAGFGTVTIPVATLLANDTDPDGDALRMVALGDAVNGTPTLVGETVLFQSVARPGEPAGFRYTVADGEGATASATVFLAVPPAAVQPSAFFGALAPEGGYQLWSLGRDGPQPVTAIGTGMDRMTLAVTDREVFVARTGDDGAFEVLRFDGVTGLRIHQSSPPSGPAQVQLTPVGDRLFFAADDVGDGTGWELRVADDDGVFAFDIAPGPPSSFPLALQAVGGQMFFSADDGFSGREPWLAAGIQALPLGDIATGPASSLPTDFTAFGGDVYFAAEEATNGRELWRWDGDQASLAADLAPGPGSSAPRLLTATADALYFAADGGIDDALWRFDGEDAAPVLLPGGVEGIVELAAGGGRLFVATQEAGRGGLWAVDGTTATRVAGPAAIDAPPAQLTPLGPQLYFTAADGRGEELWRWDGQSLTVVEVAPGPQGSVPRDLTVVDGGLLFSATDGEGGRELWLFDGQSVERADGDPLDAGDDPHGIVLAPGDWPFA